MEILKIIFTTILILDIPLAVASFVFAYILLFRRDWRNPIYFNFGMSTLFLGLWILITILTYFQIPFLSTYFLTAMSFIFGIWILHYFTIFTYKYPYQLKKDRNIIILLYILTSLFTLSFLIPNFYIIESALIFPLIYAKLNLFGLIIFIAYFLVLSILSFKNLIYKYINSGGVHKIQLRKIVIGTVIGVVANIIVIFGIYYLTPYDFTIIGVLFTTGVLMYIYSILFSK